jgi:predicted nucleic acid-binding protein
MFVDTKLLVHALVLGAPARASARAALAAHVARGERLCISRQILREFIAVVTRPQLWMQPKTAAEAASAAALFADDFDILEDGAAVWSALTDLCRQFAFGRQHRGDDAGTR